VIGSLRELGKTVFLTTHYMDEAQALADRVAILAAGRIVAVGPPGELGNRAERDNEISFRLPDGASAEDLPPSIGALARVDGRRVSLSVPDPVGPLRELTEWASQRGTGLPELEVRRPSLEDIYLELAGEQR
jgi:ABC-2 type transport system ATP-binding protein